MPTLMSCQWLCSVGKQSEAQAQQERVFSSMYQQFCQGGGNEAVRCHLCVYSSQFNLLMVPMRSWKLKVVGYLFTISFQIYLFVAYLIIKKLYHVTELQIIKMRKIGLERNNIYTHISIHTHTYTYIYIYTYIVYVYVHIHIHIYSVCICVYIRVCVHTHTHTS